MSVKLIYFVHGTTTDNESGRSTGWAPGELSELGRQQAKALKDQIHDKDFKVIFCSDLKRAVDSANLGFQNDYKIITDKRLREVDYGKLTQADESLVDDFKHINTAFPDGESMKDVEERIKGFLAYLKKEYDGEYVAIMAHRAPQLALEVLLNGKTWQQAILEDWRHKKEWQAGWIYTIN